MFADLHIHSSFSDGTDPPAELLDKARYHNITVIAISDHDTTDGVKAAGAASQKGVRLIPAIEVSTVGSGRFLHMLGYYIDIQNSALAGYIADVSAAKTENTRINFGNAVVQGCFEYEWGRVLELNAGQARLSGVHVVKCLQADGIIIPGMSMRELLWKYFRPESPHFICTEKATVQDAIDIIKTAGGVPVIAHPKVVGDDRIVLDMIRQGAKGLEVYYPLHTGEETDKYERMAREYGLFITGGSDWHGANSAPSTPCMGAAGLSHGGFDILNI